MVWRIQLGTGDGNKTDEFSEKFQNFQSKNFYCRFWAIKTGLFEHEIEKKNVILYSKNDGGGAALYFSENPTVLEPLPIP